MTDTIEGFCQKGHAMDGDTCDTCEIAAMKTALQTEQTMHAAWHKRAEQAEMERDKWRNEYDRAISTRDTEIKIRSAAEARERELREALTRLSTIQPNASINLGAAGGSAMAYAVNKIAAAALAKGGE